MENNKLIQIRDALSSNEFFERIGECLSDPQPYQFLGKMSDRLYLSKSISVRSTDVSAIKAILKKDPDALNCLPNESVFVYAATVAQQCIDSLFSSSDPEITNPSTGGLIFLTDFDYGTASKEKIDSLDKRISAGAGVAKKASPFIVFGLSGRDYIMLNRLNKLYHPHFAFVRCYIHSFNPSLANISIVEQIDLELDEEWAFQRGFMYNPQLLRPEIFSEDEKLRTFSDYYRKCYRISSGIIDLEDRAVLLE